jgi:hypothetical protein
MVIGTSFAWGHLGKTGGEATARMFAVFPELIVFADPPSVPEQHTSFTERTTDVEGKELVLNIRRLPAWMLSYQVWKSRWGVDPDYEPQTMASPYEMAQSDIADQHIAHFTANGRLTIDRWLRMEYLAPDFLTFIADRTEVSPERREQVMALGSVNALTYDHELQHWFTPAHIALMYRNNPRWAAVESSLYEDASES